MPPEWRSIPDRSAFGNNPSRGPLKTLEVAPLRPCQLADEGLSLAFPTSSPPCCTSPVDNVAWESVAFTGRETAGSSTEKKPSDIIYLGGHLMNHKCPVSRRASLKSLGVVGAAMVFGGAAEASAPPPEPKTTESDQAKRAVNAIDLAVARLGKGHSCAQAVFSAFAEQMGMDYQTAVRLSSGFGGGMGMGSVCGAVTGGIMAIGLKYGGVDPKAKGQTAKLVREFTDRFKAQHKSVNCRDLLGCDLSTPDGLKAAKDKNLFAVCPGIVEGAAKILDGVLNEVSRGAAG